jgi:hypothetical protein
MGDRKTSSLALALPHGENPFAIDEIRSRRAIRFPEVDPGSLTRRERKIYQKAREDTLAIGFGGLKGRVAVGEAAVLEDFTSAQFLATSTRIAQRLQLTHARCPFEEFRVLQNAFSLEGVKRMGGAMAAMVDVTEQGMAEVVERSLSLEEEQSLFTLLFGRRR